MTKPSNPRTLPIRRWLALALITVFVVPLLVTMVFTVAWIGDHPSYDQDRTLAQEVLQAGAGRWDDPAWQAAATDELDRNNIAFVLSEGGQEIYRSTDDPYAGPEDGEDTRFVKRLTLPGTSPEQVAIFYTNPDKGPPEEIPIELLPFVALVALALTLAGIAWYLGRTVLTPLAATSVAARQIADGDLDITLPASRVREVAELKTAFESMSDALRTSIEHQSAMEQERRLLIGAVAHDLRTPLFSLRGYLEGFELGIADTPEKRAHYIAVAKEKADALERLIADLFDFTRLEYLEQSPDREPLDFHVLLSDLMTGLNPWAEAQEVDLVLDCRGAPFTIQGDSHLLTRAVGNLLDNALRHTPAGGQVRVTCHPENGRMVFTVADSGPGIPESELPHVFTPLFRGDTSRSRRTGGAGLGLTIARRILIAHGGDLTAANHPDGGAVFTAWLPVTARA